MTGSTKASRDGPHSSRVHLLSVPVNHQTPNVNTVSLPSPPASPPASPPLPPRSPLRPRGNTTTPDARSSVSLESIPELTDMTLLHARSFGSISTMLDSRAASRPKTPDKPLPLPPPSPIPDLPNADAEGQELSMPDGPPSPIPSPSAAPVSKRTYALLELLESERNYASDLAIVQTCHIPMAMGHSTSIDPPLVTPPSSNPSSRAASTASTSLSRSSPTAPMSQDDIRIIFNNIVQIAIFADQFTERLEEALGSTLDGGTGEDHVGALFLDMIPTMEPMYNTYITRHPSAIEHFNSLPRTDAMKSFLQETSALTQTLTNAWDVPSLLIKPVQRLMKYPLLLSSIIDETPASHPDKEKLKKAREKIEAVAQGVNEGRRRLEVVREVLASGPPKKLDVVKAKRKGLNIGLAAALNLGKLKNLRPSSSSSKIPDDADDDETAHQIAEWGNQMKACQNMARLFITSAKDWSKEFTRLAEELLQWAHDFGRVIGVSDDNSSQAFDAFVAVIDDGILPSCRQFKKAIFGDLAEELASLNKMTENPEKLVAAMTTLEPLHWFLLHSDASRARHPPALLEASRSYIALRAQLHSELPRFVELLHDGISHVIMQFMEWQIRFYDEIRSKWLELWEALRVDGESQGSAEETLRVWWGRFADAEAMLSGLNIVRPPLKDAARLRARRRGSSMSDTLETGSTRSTVVISKLEPIYAPPMSAASSQTLVPPSPNSARSVSVHIQKKVSNESVHSKKSGKSSRFGHKHSHSAAVQRPPAPPPDVFDQDGMAPGYAHSMYNVPPPSPKKPPYERTKSMPISLPMPLQRANSQGRLLDGATPTLSASSSVSVRTVNGHSAPATPPQPDDYAASTDNVNIGEYPRGRPPRQPAMKRRPTESTKSAKSSTSRNRRRSPSLSTMRKLSFSSSQEPLPSPIPHDAALAVWQGRAAMSKIPAMYACEAIHPCDPPAGVSYYDYPFFTVRLGDVFDVLQELGHPSTMQDLPLQLDGGEDCLLLVRNRHGDVGWALASFLYPVD